ncbi:MAG: rod shape-determining protein MreC [bacterium]|nr:rod shape-determining protein MreC [bacterium]
MTPIATKKRREVTATVVLIIAIVLSIGLMTIWSVEGTRGPLHTMRTVTNTVVAPLQKAGAFLATPFKAVGNGITNAAADDEELLALKEENEALKAQVIEYEEYKLENDRLSELLKMTSTYSLKSVGARVIAHSADSWNQTITLNKGSSDGIEPGMPVMGGKGLLGQVESCTPSTCIVRLITDEQSGVAVMLQSTRTEGVVTGSVDGLLYLKYVPVSVNVQLGDPVITSGLGGTYPKGLVVGIVSRITSNPSDVYQTLIVQPLSESSLVTEEVLIFIGGETEATSGVDIVDKEDQ